MSQQRRIPRLSWDALRVLRLLRDEHVYGMGDPAGLGMTQDEIARETAYLIRLGLVATDRRLTGAGFQALRELGA